MTARYNGPGPRPQPQVRMRLVCRSFAAELVAAPPAGECHVWAARVGDQPDYRDILTADERERADRFTIDRPRRQFVAARGLLRTVLGRCLDVVPERVPLAVTAAGKPFVPGDRLHFNVSHSGDAVLVAVAGVRVGVDVEAVRDVPNAAGLVDRFFAAEERAAFERLPAELRAAGFLRGWTCKEAVLKAVGVGLRDVQECWVELDPREPPAVRRLDHPSESGWKLAAWEPGAGYVAAVAVESGEPLGEPGA